MHTCGSRGYQGLPETHHHSSRSKMATKTLTKALKCSRARFALALLCSAINKREEIYFLHRRFTAVWPNPLQAVREYRRPGTSWVVSAQCNGDKRIVTISTTDRAPLTRISLMTASPEWQVAGRRNIYSQRIGGVRLMGEGGWDGVAIVKNRDFLHRGKSEWQASIRGRQCR